MSRTEKVIRISWLLVSSCGDLWVVVEEDESVVLGAQFEDRNHVVIREVTKLDYIPQILH